MGYHQIVTLCQIRCQIWRINQMEWTNALRLFHVTHMETVKCIKKNESQHKQPVEFSDYVKTLIGAVITVKIRACNS